MTIEEKTEIACFLDLTLDAIQGGFRTEAKTYNFTDDSEAVNDDELKAPDSIKSLNDEIRSCTSCPLYKNRKNAVPGDGVENPLVMVIASCPGNEEDLSGNSFSGMTGERLKKMLSPVGLSPDTNCFLTTVVKCRPPQGREALPDETICCAAFLRRQILLLNPKIILCMGTIAASSLLKSDEDIDILRKKGGKIRIDNTVIPVSVTYSPNEVWENQELKRPAWEDLKKLKGLFNK